MPTVAEYKNAEIYISYDEMESLNEIEKKPTFFDTIEKEGRLNIFKESITIENVLHFRQIGGHTPGSSVLFFKDKGISYVLTGDEAYIPQNIIEQRTLGTIYNVNKNRNFLKLVKNEDMIFFTMHDNELLLDGTVIKKIF